MKKFFEKRISSAASGFSNSKLVASSTFKIAFVITALILSACQKNKQATTSEQKAKFKIVCTIGMIADVARNIVADKAEVINIMGEGIDPHLYKTTSTDVKLLMSADIIFYNGLLLEGKMSNVLANFAKKNPRVYTVADAVRVDKNFAIKDKANKEHYDPHIWMDVSAWKKVARFIADNISAYDTKNAAFYKQNFANYRKKLDALDQFAKEILASIPTKNRLMITAHDAFGYMGRAYDIEVRGIQGLSTESEAGLKDIEDLVNMIVERKLPAIFVESSVSDKNVKALIQGCQARGHNVVIGGELFSDAMGKKGTHEGTYIGMIEHNFTTITRALGGKVPMNGRQDFGK